MAVYGRTAPCASSAPAPTTGGRRCGAEGDAAVAHTGCGDGRRAARAAGAARSANVLRFCAFGATLLALVLARATSSPVVVVATVVASLALLLLLERDRRFVAVWAAYVGGFVLFAELRALADETGLAVRYDYVIEADRALFGGEVPTVWLQERLGDASVLGWAMLLVYTSYYVVPHAVALVLARRSRDTFRRYAIALMAVVYAGLLVSALVPTAPPWLAAAEGRIEPGDADRPRADRQRGREPLRPGRPARRPQPRRRLPVAAHGADRAARAPRLARRRPAPRARRRLRGGDGLRARLPRRALRDRRGRRRGARRGGVVGRRRGRASARRRAPAPHVGTAAGVATAPARST